MPRKIWQLMADLGWAGLGNSLVGSFGVETSCVSENPDRHVGRALGRRCETLSGARDPQCVEIDEGTGSNDNALRYSMRIQWSEEDQAYIVDVPELPGCTTHGASYEEAVTRAQDAMRAWIDGHRAAGYPIPLPQVYPAPDAEFPNRVQ